MSSPRECQQCKKNLATVHVTEIVAPEDEPGDSAERGFVEHHVCDVCAQALDLPHMPAHKKSHAEIWKLLQISAQQTRKKGGPVCPDCGMSLEEFRKKGRLGCAKDYEVFKAHIGEVLERVHGAREHTGRVPGTSEVESAQIQRASELRRQLELAIRDEAYENAARLRDELRALDRPESG
jgi:protein arginine kinase activator